MDLNVHVSQRAEQGLLLIPKMLQSIEVLQLGTTDLAGVIEAELASNETLEVRVPARDELPSTPERERIDEDEWTSPRAPRTRDNEGAGVHDMLANVPAASESLLAHVREQLAWCDVSVELRDAVLELTQHLDGRGFLSCGERELVEAVGEPALVPALALLRSLEPRGIGARNAVEALLMQLSPDDPDYDDIRTLLQEHLEALARNKIPEVARRLGRPVAEIHDLLGKVRELDPYPGAAFAPEAVERVRPDVQVLLRDGQLEVTVNDATLPSLGISDDYASMVRGAATPDDVKQYLRPKLESARDLIQAIDQRQKTLGRVAGAVLEYQREFLEHGAGAIRPLKMSEIADLLGMHTSTVSRAVAGKYVQTSRGIVALRSFFDGRRSGSTGTAPAQTGRLGIKEKIRGLIENEEAERPLSDDDLVVLLAAQRIDVARRTVAKYRTELGIPSSWRRRRHD